MTIYDLRIGGDGPAATRGRSTGAWKSAGQAVPLVRVHSQCLTGDVLTSLRCDCRAQLELSLQKSDERPQASCYTYRQEGRGID